MSRLATRLAKIKNKIGDMERGPMFIHRVIVDPVTRQSRDQGPLHTKLFDGRDFYSEPGEEFEDFVERIKATDMEMRPSNVYQIIEGGSDGR